MVVVAAGEVDIVVDVRVVRSLAVVFEVTVWLEIVCKNHFIQSSRLTRKQV